MPFGFLLGVGVFVAEPAAVGIALGGERLHAWVIVPFVGGPSRFVFFHDARVSYNIPGTRYY